jgi:hypothetical protein
MLLEGVDPVDEPLVALSSNNQDMAGFAGQLGAVPVGHAVGKMQRQIEADKRLPGRPLAVENAGCAFRNPILDQPLRRRQLAKVAYFLEYEPAARSRAAGIDRSAVASRHSSR